MDMPPEQPQAVAQIVIPERIPADCLKKASADYNVPALLLLAILKQESGAKVGAIGRNGNGSVDIGPAQLNSGSWVPYFNSKYGIKSSALAQNMCQAIRAQAYVLRTESNHSACAGQVMWCGVGRYHAPNNLQARVRYTWAVREQLLKIVRTGRFE